MNRIEQLAEAYASARLAEAIADPGNIKASASRSAEELAEAHQVYLEREFKSASRLLELAEHRDFSGLSNALHKSNRNWRNLFCEYASVQSIPDTQSGLRDFLRSWIGADEVDRQLADLERIRAEDEAARLAKIAERDRADWLVCPVTHNRDSGALDESNWEAQIKALSEADGDECETDNWEIHRFGHWGCGWFEIAIVRPDSAAYRAAEQLENRLEDYPVLNEEDLSEREYSDALESWNNWGANDFRKEIAHQFGLSENTVYRLDDIDDSALWEFHMEHSPNDYETHSDGPHFDFRYLEHGETPTRDQLARFLNDTRPKPEPRPFTECQLHFAIL